MVAWFSFPDAGGGAQGSSGGSGSLADGAQGCSRSSGALMRPPECGLTLRSAGPMKPVRDSQNRARVFESLGIAPESVYSPKQVHSRDVIAIDLPDLADEIPECDGVLTVNPDLVPCVSVADCMPVWLYDPESGCFGVLHSGWRGTGIVRQAIELAACEWNADVTDFRVILGPHIRSCCYTVDEERAVYFSKEFGPSCVALDPALQEAGFSWPYRLSLAEANRILCALLGIPAEHICDTGLCTACDERFGSNRREGVDSFTHMAAFIRRL